MSVKAVGLISGGMDSILAVKLVQDQRIEVYAVYFVMPWGQGNLTRCQGLAAQLGVHFKESYLGNEYLEMLKNPQYGYGSAFNPCIDCHRFMVQRAAEYMKDIGADFVFTGEVMGQRPMSQVKRCLPLIDKGTEIEGKLVRPLSARLLDETIPEREGLIDRSKLLGLSGRSRKAQFDLAKQFGITGFSAPAGGCLLTEKPFGNRLKDFLSGICRDAKETNALCFGRYFRINEQCAVMIGRDEQENLALEACGFEGDYVIELPEIAAPLALVKGSGISEDVLQISAGIIQYFSKARHAVLETAHCRAVGGESTQVTARKLSEKDIQAMWRQ